MSLKKKKNEKKRRGKKKKIFKPQNPSAIPSSFSKNSGAVINRKNLNYLNCIREINAKIKFFIKKKK